jgi:hypothetical protein
MNNSRRKQQKIVFTESLRVQKQRLDRPIFKAFLIKIKNRKLDLESLVGYSKINPKIGGLWGIDIPGSTRRLKDLAKDLGPNISQGHPFVGLGRDV